MKRKLLVVIFCGLPFLALAQKKETKAPADSSKTVLTKKDSIKAKPPKKQKEPKRQSDFQSRISLQINGGSQGFGADVKAGIINHLALRAGADFLPITVNNIFSFDGFDSSNDMTVKFNNIHLFAEYYPAKNGTFRIVGGVGYLYKAQSVITVTPNGSSYSFGAQTVTADQIGNLNMTIDWKGAAPYLGIGLFRTFPSHFFNVNLDLGTYYLTTPHTTIIGTKMLASNSALEPQFNENLKGYRFLPVLQLNFNFRLK